MKGGSYNCKKWTWSVLAVMKGAKKEEANLVGGRGTQNKMRDDVQSALNKVTVAQHLFPERHAAQRLDLSGSVHQRLNADFPAAADRNQSTQAQVNDISICFVQLGYFK